MSWQPSAFVTAGVEIVTDNPDSVPCRRVMTAAHDVKGYARRVP
ncbi:hypothetical protein [Streptomyces sp. ICN903]|nr:hypothetical protein [Streptomyces sp. ICN903]